MLSMSRNRIRREYEDRVQASSPQEIILYACDAGEAAKDSLSYSLFLQRATQLALVRSNSRFLSVVQAHCKAADLKRMALPLAASTFPAWSRIPHGSSNQVAADVSMSRADHRFSCV